MALPKTACPIPACAKQVAVRPVKDRPDWWRIQRHTHPDGETCPGSRTDVQLGANPDHLAPSDAPDPAPAVDPKAPPIGTELDGHLAPNDYVELPGTLVGGLTIWGHTAGLQVRPAHCPQDQTVAALAIDESCPVVDGIYLLDADTSRAIRDLLNIATARGIL